MDGVENNRLCRLSGPGRQGWPTVSSVVAAQGHFVFRASDIALGLDVELELEGEG